MSILKEVFSEDVKKEVWNKAKTVVGYNANNIRLDSCGAVMKWKDYGNTTSSFGWEIDHIKPLSKNGSNDLYNLQALQWENNRSKSDDFPNWLCKVKAS